MSRLIGTLAMCLLLAFTLYAAHNGTETPGLSMDSLANKASISLSHAYKFVESVILPASAMTASAEAEEGEEKSEAEVSSADGDEKSEEAKEEESTFEGHYWKPMT